MRSFTQFHLSPSDYQLFSKIKEFLAGVCLDRDEELVHNQQVVKKQNTAENVNDNGIKKLVSRYDKWLLAMKIMSKSI